MKRLNFCVATFLFFPIALAAQWNPSGSSTSANIYREGNVGVAMNLTPEVRLDIGNSHGTGLQFRSGNNTDYRIRLAPYWEDYGNTRLDFNIDRDVNGGFTTIMSVGYGFNVGIGTITPDAKLTLQNTATGLNSGILIKDGVSNSRGAIYYSGAQDLVIDALSIPSGDAPTFKIRTGGADRITVMKDGNVGIGTTTPVHKLDVAGNLSTTNLTINPTANGNAQIYFKNQGSLDWDLGTQVGIASQDFSLYNRGTSSVALSISKSSNNSTFYGGLAINGTTGGNAQIYFKNQGSLDWDLGTQVAVASQDFNLYNRGTASVALSVNKSSNNIGIGTTNPGSFKLAVEGKIGAREVNVTIANPWPDYVFEKDYDLPSLQQIKNYIDQHKRLPDVPSGKEIEASGLNVGEMNAILLKKVEELTLHLIEKEQQLEALEKRFEKLENTLEKK